MQSQVVFSIVSYKKTEKATRVNELEMLRNSRTARKCRIFDYSFYHADFFACENLQFICEGRIFGSLNLTN